MGRDSCPQRGQLIFVQLISRKKAEMMVLGGQIQKPRVAETDTIGVPIRVLICAKITGLLPG